MKTITIIRIIISALCVGLILCVLFGKSVISTGLGFDLAYSYINYITGKIAGAYPQFIAYLYLLLIFSPVCILFIWLRKYYFSYIAAFISCALGLYQFYREVSWLVGKNKNIADGFNGFYDNMLIFLPLVIGALCFCLAWQISIWQKKEYASFGSMACADNTQK